MSCLRRSVWGVLLVALAASHAAAQDPLSKSPTSRSRAVPAQTQSQAAKTLPRSHRPDQLMQAGHTNLIQAFALSTDGRWLASGGYDKVILVWDSATGEEHSRFSGHSATITQLAFSPDGNRLCSADANGRIKVWNMQKGSVVYTLNLLGPVKHLAFSADGKFWAAGVDAAKEGSTAKIELHNAATGIVLLTIPTKWSLVSAMTLTADGLLIASGAIGDDDAPDGTVNVWNVVSGQLLKSLPILAGTVSPDGRWMARVDYSPQVRVVISDLASGQEKLSLPVRNPGLVFFSPDGQTLAVTDAGNPELKLWSVATGKEIATLSADKSIGALGLTAATFSVDGKLLVASPYSGFSIKSWDWAEGRAVRTFYGQNLIQGIASSPDGGWLVAGSHEGLSIWNVATAKRIATLPSGPVNQVAFSPDGRWLASNPGAQFAGETLKVWDMKSRTLAAEFTFGKGGTPVLSVAFAGNASLLKQVSTFTRSWEFTADGQTHTIWSSTSPLAVSPDGKLLAAQSGIGGNVEIWDMVSARKLTVLAVHTISISALSFSSDGRWLVTAGAETSPSSSIDRAGNSTSQWAVKVWDVNTWKEHLAQSFSRVGAPCAIFSPDGHRLAIEKSWERIELLDVDRGVPIATLTAIDLWPQHHQFSSGNFAFSPDGTLLYGGAQNGIRLWKLTPK